MDKYQFIALVELLRAKPDSVAIRGAYLVLIDGFTQTRAATILGCRQSTVSHAVRRIKNAQRLANKGAARH